MTSRRERKKVERHLARLKRVPRLDQLRLRNPNGARDKSLLAATARTLSPSNPQVAGSAWPPRYGSVSPVHLWRSGYGIQGH